MDGEPKPDVFRQCSREYNLAVPDPRDHSHPSVPWFPQALALPLAPSNRITSDDDAKTCWSRRGALAVAGSTSLCVFSSSVAGDVDCGTPPGGADAGEAKQRGFSAVLLRECLEVRRPPRAMCCVSRFWRATPTLTANSRPHPADDTVGGRKFPTHISSQAVSGKMLPRTKRSP